MITEIYEGNAIEMQRMLRNLKRRLIRAVPTAGGFIIMHVAE